MSIEPLQFPPGWKVFPCAKGSKQPVEGLVDWPQRASDDAQQIASWAVEYPDCNWAVALGPSGLAVLDVDGATGEESLLSYELLHGPLPETREHRTPRSGRHLIYRDDFQLCPNSVGKLGKKLDTRGQNGYIVIPPSSFEGKSYDIIAQRDIAELPDHVSSDAGKRREAVKSADGITLDDDGQMGRARRLLYDYVQRGHVAIAGAGGDDRTYQVCCEVLNLGLSEDAAFKLIDEIWNVACVPPWDVEELWTKIRNASSYAQNETGAWAVPPAGERVPLDALDRLIAEAVDAPAPGETDRPTQRFHWMDEAELRNLEPPAWLIPEMLTVNSVNMLYGPSGHFKSFIGLNIAAQVALGNQCAFYVAAEGLARMAKKDFPAWKTAYGVEQRIPLFMVDEMPLYDQDELDYRLFSASIAAKAEAEGRPVGIIFLDTLNRALIGLEENSASDVAKFLRIADKLRRAFRCAVVMVHHTPADGKDPRGSSALYAGCDTVLKVIADKDVRVVRMHVTKQKSDEERQLPFCYQGEKIGTGLAFLPIENKIARVLTGETDIFSLKSVMDALARQNAYGDVGLPSRGLVMELFPRRQDETEESYNAQLRIGQKGLDGAAKKHKLDGLFAGYGKDRRWSLPAPQEKPAE